MSALSLILWKLYMQPLSWPLTGRRFGDDIKKRLQSGIAKACNSFGGYLLCLLGSNLSKDAKASHTTSRSAFFSGFIVPNLCLAKPGPRMGTRNSLLQGLAGKRIATVG